MVRWLDLITSNLPWFMDLTFQVPHVVLFFAASDLTFITRHIHNWASFLLWLSHFILHELLVVLCSSPVACWAPSDKADSSFSAVSSCPFIQFMRFSQQLYWGGWPFLPPVDRVLSELSTVTHLSSVVLHGMTYRFTELGKLFSHDKAVIPEGHLNVNSI